MRAAEQADAADEVREGKAARPSQLIRGVRRLQREVGNGMTALLLLLAMAIQAGPAALGPERIELAVQRGNAGAIVAELWGGDAAGARLFLRGVGSGAAKWLHAAHSIYSATDAGARSELDDALAAALVAAPYAALPILRELWWQSDNNQICVFGADSELPGGVPEYLSTLERSLAVAPPTDLTAMRQACVAGLRRTRKHLKGA